jgi:hypothetical protein
MLQGDGKGKHVRLIIEDYTQYLGIECVIIIMV